MPHHDRKLPCHNPENDSPYQVVTVDKLSDAPVYSLSDNFVDDMIVLHKIVFASGVPNYVQVRQQVYSNWNIEYLMNCLQDYPDNSVVELLQFGFPVGYDKDSPPSSANRTHRGAREFSNAVQDYLNLETCLGATLGPFSFNPLCTELTLSPLNTVEKDQGAKRRVILDLSWPEGLSVNDGIPRDRYLGEDTSLTYPSVESLLDIIREKGPGCLLFKRDLRRAYRQLPVDPGDIHLLGYSWNADYYIDRVFPFGLRSAAFICQRVTSALAYIAHQQGISCVNYLDDFGGAEVPQRANTACNKLGDILQQAGVEEAMDKACAPASTMVFLGIEIDTEKMETWVPCDKLDMLNKSLPEWLHKTACTKRELQSLIGRLAFLSKCVAPGRLFFSRMLECLRGLDRDEDSVVLTPEFHRDVQWCFSFVRQYNEVSIIKTDPWIDADVFLSTDACLVGCGGVCGESYFHASFPEMVLHTAGL